GLQRSTKVYTVEFRDRDRRPRGNRGISPRAMPRPVRIVPAGWLPGGRVRPLLEQQISGADQNKGQWLRQAVLKRDVLLRGFLAFAGRLSRSVRFKGNRGIPLFSKSI